MTYVFAQCKKRRRNCGFAIQLFPDCHWLFPSFQPAHSHVFISYPCSQNCILCSVLKSETSPPSSKGTTASLTLVLSDESHDESIISVNIIISVETIMKTSCRMCRSRHQRLGIATNETMSVYYRVADRSSDPSFFLKKASRSFLLCMRYPVLEISYIPTGTIWLHVS